VRQPMVAVSYGADSLQAIDADPGGRPNSKVVVMIPWTAPRPRRTSLMVS
jgi:hypothetical protein